MRQSPWSLTTILKYALLQLPGLAFLLLLLFWLDSRYDFPPWLFWAVLVLWLGKDLLLYTLVWRSYAPWPAKDRLIGARGIAREDLAPQGTVEVQGGLWRGEVAAGEAPVARGMAVRVVAIKGLTLLVTPETPSPGDRGHSG